MEQREYTTAEMSMVWYRKTLKTKEEQEREMITTTMNQELGFALFRWRTPEETIIIYIYILFGICVCG